MYTIHADGEVLHAPHLFNEGRGVLSPKLTVELNKAGSLDFTLPPNNALYDDIKKLKSIITVFQNEKEMFRGRVLHDEKDFYKQKKVFCEGELAFLLDSLQRPYATTTTRKSMFQRYITNHNSRVEAAKRFTVGKITVSNTDSVLFENKNYPTTIDEINEKLISDVGGYIKTRGSGNTRYIDWLEESGEVSTQIIEFGVNLLDITEYISAENVFTVLIPQGATIDSEDGSSDEKLDITSVNGGKDYIENSTGVSLFGRIERKVEWSEIKNATTLLSTAKKYLENSIEMAVTLELRAIDLSLLDVSVDQIHLGDWVRVLSLPHGLDKMFQCTKIVYDLANPDLNEYTFGISFTSLTDKQVASEKTASDVKSAANRANQAASKAEKVIASVPTSSIPTPDIDVIWSTHFS